MINQERKNQQIDFLLCGAIVGGVSAGGVFGTQSAFAIDLTDVNTSMNSIVTNADGTADVAFPIGAAALALTIIAMIVRRFVMV